MADLFSNVLPVEIGERATPFSNLVRLFLDFVYPCLHARNLILEISLVALQPLLLLFRSEMMVTMRHAASAK